MLRGLISNEILLQLCDDDGVGAFVTDPANTAYTNLVQAIVQADNTIDSYLTGHYDVPLPETPPSVADASANLALCNLYGRRHEMIVPDGIAARRKDVMKWLVDVQEGKANIPELYTDAPSSALSSRTADDRVFTDDVLDKY
jgi:phage gp36-like protein